jgi:oligoendopeptidase F
MSFDQHSLPSWNLSQYYSSHKDPAIFEDLTLVKSEIQYFSKTYKGNVATLSASQIHNALEEQQEILVKLNKPNYFLMLCYEAGGSEVESVGQIKTKAEEIIANLSNELVFWDVELAKRSDLIELSKTSELAEYSYLLERTAKDAKHILSEEAEQILNLKSLTSNTAWSKLYTDMKGKIQVTYDFGDGEKIYRTPDLSDKMMSPDRIVRAKAWELLTGEYQKNEEIVLEAYNNILLDCKIDDSLRGFADCEDSKLLQNQVSRQTVNNLITSIQNHTNIYREYILLKQEILGIEKMNYYDVSAQISFDGIEEKEYSWEECREIILDAFKNFDSDFARIAQQFFDENWIDAQVRERKYGGAFMADFAPGFHPVILCNYKGKLEDILTVAHELGHGIHSVLMNEKQKYLNTHYSMTVAEIASLCCETIVFNALLQNTTDPKHKLKLLCIKIEQETGNIFIGGLGRYLFERKMHEMYRESGPISKEQVRELWLEKYFKSMFEDTINVGHGGEFTWQSVAHFTSIFYNYVYASGLLISSGIFQILQQDKTQIEIYKAMLGSGGSLAHRICLE